MSFPAPTVDLTSDTGLSGSDLISNRAILKGTADAGTKVQISEGDTVLGTASVGLNGSWSFNPTGLADGAHTLKLVSTDAAGNVSSLTSFTFTLDTTGPATPSVSLTNDTGSSGSDLITSDGTLRGSAEAGSTVKITDGGTVLGTTIAGSDGSWSYAPTGLRDGAHSIKVVATDAAGNSPPCQEF